MKKPAVEQVPEVAAEGSGVMGDILHRDGTLSAIQVRQVVRLQRDEHIRFGEAAIRLGMLSDADVRRALARQYEYPFIKSGEFSLIDRSLFAAYKPFEPPAEALRTLRSQLSLTYFNGRKRVLAVVSPRDGVPGSRLAANLALTFAQLGERTLLIDANMRSPRQHRLFGFQDNEGLSAVLGGRCSFKAALRQVAPFSQLSLLCAGAAVPNPQELLARADFSNLMLGVPTKFSAIIVDVPPALECADAQLVAARAGACVMVARRHHTRVKDMRRAKQLLAATRTELLGVAIGD